MATRKKTIDQIKGEKAPPEAREKSAVAYFNENGSREKGEEKQPADTTKILDNELKKKP